MRNKLSKKCNKFLTILLPLFLTAALVFPVFAETKDELDSANDLKTELEAQVAASEAKLADLKESAAALEEKIAEIDSEIDDIGAIIDDYQAKEAELQAEIDDLNERIAEEENEIAEKYARMKLRIQYMYENESDSYFEAIFSSGSIAELFKKLQYILDLNAYDKNMMNQLKALTDELSENEALVESNLDDVDALKIAQENQMDVLQSLYDVKTEELEVTEEDIASEEAEILAINADLEANAEIIFALSAQYDAELAAARAAAEKAAAEAAEKAAAEAAEKAAAEAEASEDTSFVDVEVDGADSDYVMSAESDDGSSYEDDGETDDYYEASLTTGTWIWPLEDYTYVSSGFGERWGSFHYGIDIPAPEGTPVMAVDGGIVVIARYTPTADTGNYIVIYHGDDIYSEYMHLSEIYVSAGETVSQGQYIGAVGSTGDSTGNHLHLSKGIGSTYWLNRVAPF